jgi:hypothetical protein
MQTIQAGTVTVQTSSLNVYKQLDDETVATVNANGLVLLWAVDGDETMQIGGIGKGTSNLTTDELIAKIWKN